MTVVLIVADRRAWPSRWSALGAARLGARPPAPTPKPVPATGARRILFPFVAAALSRARSTPRCGWPSAEDATLVPVFLARVPLQPAARRPAAAAVRDRRSRCSEAIEQRAAAVRGPGRRADRARPDLPPRAAPGDRRGAVRPDRDRGRGPRQPGLRPRRRRLAARECPRRDRRPAAELRGRFRALGQRRTGAQARPGAAASGPPRRSPGQSCRWNGSVATTTSVRAFSTASSSRAALVVEDLVAALARHDLGDQHGHDCRVLVLVDRLDVVQHLRTSERCGSRRTSIGTAHAHSIPVAA